MRYLVTGGAGFIGSHLVINLLEAGHEVFIIDNLSTGHYDAIHKDATFFEVDLLNKDALDKAVSCKKWDGVFHFAALSVVGDSICNPFFYIQNNVKTSINLIESCIKYGIKYFVFSSTAALFGGKLQNIPIPDNEKIDPGSPYGESKFFIERLLVWAEKIYGMHSACLRYFNAAGADINGQLGEDHRPETHLIPLAIDTALGLRPKIKIFGNDYNTKDGTCIRDYIHVNDLAHAHILALDQIKDRSVIYNLGNGHGFSNLEIIQSVERICGHPISWEWDARRIGDPEVLIADSSKIRNDTGWSPHYSDIDTIIESAFRWRKTHPKGYKR